MEIHDFDISSETGLFDDANYKLDLLLQLFPEGDFNFLKRKSLEYASNDSAFETFINDALSLDIVPPASSNQGTNPSEDVPPTTFDVESFVDTYPDPFGFFEKLQRSPKSQRIIVDILKDRFRNVKASYIEHVVIEKNYRLLQSADALQTPPAEHVRISPRDEAAVNITDMEDIVRQEVLLLDHRHEIEEYLSLQREIKKAAIEEGSVFECECCFTEDLLPNEIIMCTEAHIFCRSCIKTNTEVRIGNGLTTFPCPLMGGCTPDGVIPLKAIKEVISANAYEKLTARIQEEEVKKADITGIEYCQRCEYAAVLDENILIFKCAKCGFELCRQCNKESHIPRKCGETPQEDAQKQLRKQEEEFHTNKVLRRCGGCKKPYVKIEGCDKVVCTCGVANCYRCGQYGIDYPHLNSCPGRLM